MQSEREGWALATCLRPARVQCRLSDEVRDERRESDLKSMAFDDSAWLERIHRAAIRAGCVMIMAEGKENAWVRRPDRHVRVRTIGGKRCAIKFNGVLRGLCGLSHGD